MTTTGFDLLFGVVIVDRFVLFFQRGRRSVLVDLVVIVDRFVLLFDRGRLSVLVDLVVVIDSYQGAGIFFLNSSIKRSCTETWALGCLYGAAVPLAIL